jgi:hypothetical protein
MGQTLTKEELLKAYHGFKKIRKKDWQSLWIIKHVDLQDCYVYDSGCTGNSWLSDIYNGIGEWELFEEEPIEKTTTNTSIRVKDLPEDIKRIVYEYARSQNRNISEDGVINGCFEFNKTPENFDIWNQVSIGQYKSFYDFRNQRRKNYDDLDPLVRIKEGDTVKFIGPDTDSVNLIYGVSSYIGYLSHFLYNTEYTVGYTYSDNSITIETDDKKHKLIMPPTCFKLVKRKEEDRKSVV